MKPRRSLGDWLLYQQQLHPTSIDLGLERVRSVAMRLGLLPVTAPVVIVGGTNGKGSTATTLAGLLQACGRRVGLFTSPHLQRYNERIRVDDLDVSDELLTSAFEEIESARAGITLTYFEYSTLAALWLFKQQRVDAMVLEVGLGGRLDATNIVDADVAIVCSIGLDHTEWLGNTLAAIGREKAGIFRARRPVVLGSAAMPDSIFSVATELSCPVSVAQRHFQWQQHRDGGWSYHDSLGRLDNLAAPQLPGAIQYQNAATAIAALRLLLPECRATTDARLLSTGLAAVRLPGRLQRWRELPEWLLDVAHNPAAAAILAEELRQAPSRGRTVAVFGLLADKDASNIVSALDAQIDYWCLCDVDDPRGLTARALRQRMGTTRGVVESCGGVAEACERARSLTSPFDRVVVAGSFHVVGPALEWLRKSAV